jgi:hypothetical protein
MEDSIFNAGQVHYINGVKVYHMQIDDRLGVFTTSDNLDFINDHDCFFMIQCLYSLSL